MNNSSAFTKSFKKETTTAPAAETPKEDIVVEQPKQEVVQEETVVADQKEVVEAPKTADKEVKEDVVVDDKKPVVEEVKAEIVSAPKKEDPKAVEPKYDEDTERFLKFQKEHEGTMQQYLELKKDWSSISDIEVLRAQERDESGLELSDADADLLLRKKYNLDEDSSFDSLDKADELAIRRDAGKYRKNKENSRKEILTSLDNIEEVAQIEEPGGSVDDEVLLSTGQRVNAKEYQKQRDEYLNARQKAVDSIEEFATSFVFKDADGEKTIDVKMPYSEEDKHSMLSYSEDTVKPIQQFYDEQGNFNHRDYNEGLLWLNKKWRENQIKKILNNTFSKGIDTQVKNERNINLSKTPSEPTQPTKKTNQIDKSRLPNANGMKPKFSLNR